MFGKINDDYYPTPESLAIKMSCMIDPEYSRSILEPSAGKGNLVEAVKNKFKYRYISVDCIEKEPDLKSCLLGKNFNVIDDDFLTFDCIKQYDTIIMNPPFSNGVNHVLKAWNIIYDGDVIALLNAESIKNPHTKERKLLKSIIDNNGTVEFLQNTFVSAENKTNVEVALIKLSKRNKVSDYFTTIEKDVKDIEIEETKNNHLVLTESQISNMVIAYNKSIELKKESILKNAESIYYQSIMNLGTDKFDVKREINEYVDKLRERSWNSIIRIADFKKYMTEKVLNDFLKQLPQITNLEFTEKNINGFLKNLVLNFDNIINDCCLNVFDDLTKYHEENRVYVEGWKSNNYFFVNKRVVLPWMVEPGYTKGYRLRWQSETKLEDLDRVMAFIDGKKQPDIPLTSVFNKTEIETNKKYESEYFYIRFYKKGTAHVYFKNLKLLEKFNIFVGRQRGWLPKQDNKIPEKFWLMNK